jgi:hypothetical protein
VGAKVQSDEDSVKSDQSENRPGLSALLACTPYRRGDTADALTALLGRQPGAARLTGPHKARTSAASS